MTSAQGSLQIAGDRRVLTTSDTPPAWGWLDRREAAIAKLDWPTFEPRQLSPLARPAREPASFTGLYEAATDRGSLELLLPTDVTFQEEGPARTVILRGAASSLSLTFVVSPELTTLRWVLEPGGGDATARADILDFLYAMSGDGFLTLRDVERDAFVGKIRLFAEAFPEDMERDRAFLSDLATIEEWAGLTVPVPTEASAEEVGLVAEAARFIRARQIALRLQALKAAAPRGTPDPDELRLEQDLGLSLFGYEVPLGTARVAVPVRVANRAPDPERAELDVLAFAPSDDIWERIFEIDPPVTRRPEHRRTWVEGEDKASTAAIDSAQRYFWSAEWQRGERAAERDLREGRTSRYPTDDDFVKELEREIEGDGRA
jgi:hypothetical protein